MTTLTQKQETTGIPRSALRHRPIQPESQKLEALKALNIARTQHKQTRHTPHTFGGLPSGAQATPQSNPSHTGTMPPLVIIGASMVATLALLWALQGLWQWTSTQFDTLRYGYPRTTQVDHLVGHETGAIPSHFQATNLGGQIYVLEIPGGNAAASHLLVGPHLIGPDADLAPVQLAFQGDPQHPDLLIEVRGMVMRFHNTGKTYVPVTSP